MEQSNVEKCVQWLLKNDLAYRLLDEINFRNFIICLDNTAYTARTGHGICLSEVLQLSTRGFCKKNCSDLVLWVSDASTLLSIYFREGSTFTLNADYIASQLNNTHSNIIQNQLHTPNEAKQYDKKKEKLAFVKAALKEQEESIRLPVSKDDIIDAIIDFMEKHRDYVTKTIQCAKFDDIYFCIPFMKPDFEITKVVYAAATKELETILDRRVHISLKNSYLHLKLLKKTQDS